MIEIDINFDTSRFDKMKSGFPERIAAAKARALRAIGQIVAARATLAFRTPSLRPSTWAPRKPSKRDDGHPLLIKSGALRQSINWKLSGADTVIVGTDRKYAPYHQHGTKHMPARPFMPIDKNGKLLPEVEERITKKVEQTIANELENL